MLSTSNPRLPSRTALQESGAHTKGRKAKAKRKAAARRPTAQPAKHLSAGPVNSVPVE